MKRVELRRSPSSAEPKKRKAIARRSAKMIAIYTGPNGRAEFVAKTLKERPVCQAGEVIGSHLLDRFFADRSIGITAAQTMGPKRWVKCTHDSVDVHEKLARSSAGSKSKRKILLDPTNVLAVCRNCHTWIGDNSKAAIAIGLKLSKHPGRNVPQEQP